MSRGFSPLAPFLPPMVLTNKQPESIADLMDYQPLITEACMEYNNECWIGQARHFVDMQHHNPTALGLLKTLHLPDKPGPPDASNALAWLINLLTVTQSLNLLQIHIKQLMASDSGSNYCPYIHVLIPVANINTSVICLLMTQPFQMYIK